MVRNLRRPDVADERARCQRRDVGGGGHPRICVRRRRRKVFCWGENAAGQLGDGTTEDRETPVQAGDLTGVTAVSTDGHHLRDQRRRRLLLGQQLVRATGQQVGRRQLNPVRVPGLSGVTAIATHSETTCAVAGGAAHCWGAMTPDRSATVRRTTAVHRPGCPDCHVSPRSRRRTGPPAP